MNATLKGPNGQISLEPSPYPYTIGRATDNQLVVNDVRASSRHAQILPAGQGYEIIDLASSNGTFVNEQRIAPQMPRQLAAQDRIRIGDTTFVFEMTGMPSQSSMEPTVYAAGSQNGSSWYAPNVVESFPNYGAEQYAAPQELPVPAPYDANGYNTPWANNGAYAPGYAANGYGTPPVNANANLPGPQKKSGRGKLWIILGAVVSLLLITAIVFGVVGYANRSTATKTLNAFCTALKAGDYQTAYNQLSSGLQTKFGSEAVFAQAYSNNGGLGKIIGCSVTNVNDGANTGTIIYTFSQGNGNTLTEDYSLVNENSAMKISAQNPRSTPTLTLNTYCNALVQQDYQTAYNQLSTSLQNQIGSESQFASIVTGGNLKGCTFSNVNDIAGTGILTYARGDGNRTSAAATLTNQNNTWKISVLKTISSPTETLLTYCDALKVQDYQSAYAQLSSSAQSQESESQFAANFSTVTVSDCKVSNVNDTAGIGAITYTLSNGNSGTLYYTLINESGTWKINSEKQQA